MTGGRAVSARPPRPSRRPLRGLLRVRLSAFFVSFSLMLRACESFDSAVFQCESNQGLTNSVNVENRIDSQTLRRARRARLEGRGRLSVLAMERVVRLRRGLMLRDARLRGQIGRAHV